MSAVGRADTTPTVLHTYNLPMTTNAERFDHWIRGTFAELNTQLEERYFAQADRAVVTGVGEELKTQLRAEGNDHVARLLAEGNTDEGFDAGFDLLGNVGLFMAACARHGAAASRWSAAGYVSGSTIPIGAEPAR